MPIRHVYFLLQISLHNIQEHALHITKNVRNTLFISYLTAHAVTDSF